LTELFDLALATCIKSLKSHFSTSNNPNKVVINLKFKNKIKLTLKVEEQN